MFPTVLFAVLSLTILTGALPYHRPLALSKRNTTSQIDAFLFAHNSMRALHNATALTWNPQYAALAEQWVDQCHFQRTNGSLSATQYGELHTAATGIFPIVTAIDQFTKDEVLYDPANPTFGHWTQIVWKSTTTVGCGRATCPDLFGPGTGNATYYACFYDPAGNVIGEAQSNVQLF